MVWPPQVPPGRHGPPGPPPTEGRWSRRQLPPHGGLVGRRGWQTVGRGACDSCLWTRVAGAAVWAAFRPRPASQPLVHQGPAPLLCLPPPLLLLVLLLLLLLLLLMLLLLLVLLLLLLLLLLLRLVLLLLLLRMGMGATGMGPVHPNQGTRGA